MVPIFTIMRSWFFLSAVLPIVTLAFQQSSVLPLQQHQLLQSSQLFGISSPDSDGAPMSSTITTINQRRKLLTAATAAAAAAWINPTAAIADPFSDSTQATSIDLPIGLLESRVLDNVFSPPPYGMEAPDVIYPSWFSGVWKVVSECTQVVAPCGIAFFGGNRTYAAALADQGPARALRYESRFLPLGGGGGTIADREYNVKSIAKVAMGANAVVDVSLATPNKFSCLLSPEGAPTMLTVDLLVLNRRQETIDETHFHASEVVREIVSPVDKGVSRKTSTILKEIETTSLYTFKADGGVTCRQRSATFLLPSQQDPMALQMWQATRGRPIDVRFYNVEYTKA